MGPGKILGNRKNEKHGDNIIFLAPARYNNKAITLKT